MKNKATLFFAVAITLLIIGCFFFVYRVYYWLPEIVWNEAPDKVIIWSDPGCMHIDTNYIPTVQVWGDGRIVWVEHTSDWRRTVWQGQITQAEIKQIVSRLIGAGFFRFRLRGEKECVGEFLNVELLNDRDRRRASPENTELNEIYNFLKTGFGARGEEYIPETGLLYAHPVENVGLPADSKAQYYWPYDEFGYNLGEIHTQNNGRMITGDEVQFVWKVVNSETNLVESNGVVYWVAIEIPGMFP